MKRILLAVVLSAVTFGQPRLAVWRNHVWSYTAPPVPAMLRGGPGIIVAQPLDGKREPGCGLCVDGHGGGSSVCNWSAESTARNVSGGHDLDGERSGQPDVLRWRKVEKGSMRLRKAILVFATLPLIGQTPTPDVIPIWAGHGWKFLALDGATIKQVAGKLTVPVTAGPQGPQGIPGPAGPVAPQGSGAPAFTPAANDLYAVGVPPASIRLQCAGADIYRNGFLQHESGLDYAVDATGLLATFTTPPADGDVVAVRYRCHP